jgi:transposase
MRRAPEIKLNEVQRVELLNWSRSRTLPMRQVSRAKILLLAADGQQDLAIAAAVGCGRQRCARVRQRFLQAGLDGVRQDAPRSGRPPKHDAQQIVSLTTTSLPAQATDWSRTLMAAAAGVSPSTVGRVWRRHGLKPHRVTTFKVSRDPQFAEKLEAIVGLYLAPPERALVLCVDEKSQIQALDRTQPGLPLRQGRQRTQTHDYKRHGTTTLFAALSTLDGKVIGTCLPRHRHQEFVRFLAQIDAETPPTLELHLIVDNYATHKHPKVKAWLNRHPRFHFHFTPTSASWLNMVERFFRDLTTRRVRAGIFKSVAELEAAIADYLRHHNTKPKPFIWTAKATDILAKVTRAKAALVKVQNL